MSKLFVALVSTALFSCSATPSHLSLGSAEGPRAARLDCGECPGDCAEECTVVCVDPVCGECVVTLRCDGDICTVVSCDPLAPGEKAPADARRVDCPAVCGSNCPK